MKKMGLEESTTLSVKLSLTKHSPG